MPFAIGEIRLLDLDKKRFDFNLQFEQLFFSIVPSVIFILASLWHTLSQVRNPIVVHAPRFQRAKLAAIAAYFCLALALLALAAANHLHVSTMLIAADILRLIAVLLMITLSTIDHSRNPQKARSLQQSGAKATLT